MNKLLDRRFDPREKRSRRTYELEDELYDFLKYASKKYRASVSDILNACIRELIESKNLKVYKSKKGVLYPAHNFNVNESNIRGLGDLKQETTYKMTALVSMAIRNVMEMEEEE